MSPFVVERQRDEPEEELPATDYGEGTIDCVLPTFAEDIERHSATYLDDKLRRVEPTLMVKATAMLNDTLIYPVGFLCLMMTTMVYSALDKIANTWQSLPLDIRQWCRWMAVSVTLAMVIAAIGIHAWDDSRHDDKGVDALPNMEWYARDDEYFDRNIDETRTRNVTCIAKGLTPYSQIHTFVAFDELGNRYRVGVDSYAQFSCIIDGDIRDISA